MGRLNQFLNDDLVSKSSVKEIGIGGFLLYADEETVINFVSTVPKIPLEKGSVISDNVILQPITINLTGKVAKVVYKQNIIAETFDVPDRVLGHMNAYLRPKTEAAQQQIEQLKNSINNNINKVDQVVSDSESIGDIVGVDVGAEDIEDQFIKSLELFRNSKKVITIDTPSRQYKNMIIEEAITTKNNKENFLEFKINATQIRFVETQEEGIDTGKSYPNASKALRGQASSKAFKGVQTGVEMPRSILSDLVGGF